MGPRGTRASGQCSVVSGQQDRGMPGSVKCPNCGSSRSRRGGMIIWSIYLALIAMALPAVLVWRLNAAIVAGVMIAVIILANLIVNQRVCLECGSQWRAG